MSKSSGILKIIILMVGIMFTGLLLESIPKYVKWFRLNKEYELNLKIDSQEGIKTPPCIISVIL